MGVSEMTSFLSDDRFAGIKYTSNDFFTMEQCKTAFPHKILYNGYDEMCLAGLAMGADGAIGSTYNFMADKFVKIYDLMQEGKVEEAKAIQKEANKLIAVLVKNGVMQSEKEILNLLGYNMGVCRKPFGELTAEQKESVKNEILPYVHA